MNVYVFPLYALTCRTEEGNPLSPNRNIKAWILSWLLMWKSQNMSELDVFVAGSFL